MAEMNVRIARQLLKIAREIMAVDPTVDPLSSQVAAPPSSSNASFEEWKKDLESINTENAIYQTTVQFNINNINAERFPTNYNTITFSLDALYMIDKYSVDGLTRRIKRMGYDINTLPQSLIDSFFGDGIINTSDNRSTITSAVTIKEDVGSNDVSIYITPKQFKFNGEEETLKLRPDSSFGRVITFCSTLIQNKKFDPNNSNYRKEIFKEFLNGYALQLIKNCSVNPYSEQELAMNFVEHCKEEGYGPNIRYLSMEDPNK